jgi:prepilin-type N-terminal cleavage/methylation domain-containing protein
MTEMNKKGMTLIEMLTVVTIIAVLAAVLMPALGKARTKAKCATAQRNIDQLVSALTSYATDYGFYPIGNGTNSHGLINALESTPTTSPGASPKGPYLTIPTNQKVNSPTDNSWKDPWENGYKYRYPIRTISQGGDFTQEDCLKRGIQFQIWSIGPDKDAGTPDYGTIGSGNDDITNW